MIISSPTGERRGALPRPESFPCADNPNSDSSGWRACWLFALVILWLANLASFFFWLARDTCGGLN